MKIAQVKTSTIALTSAQCQQLKGGTQELLESSSIIITIDDDIA